MSWASHPTNEMPATSPTAGRHRRRRSSVIGLSVGGALLVVAVAGLMLSPSLLGWPPPTSSAGLALSGSATPSGVRPDGSPAPAVALLLSSAVPSTPPTPTGATATEPTTTKVTQSLTPTTTAAATGIASIEDEVLRLTNLQRVSHGCAALRADTKLRTAARDHSADMASRQELTHTGADGSDPGTRMKQAGYNTDGGWAENVAEGYPTPEAVMTGWMSSEGHRDNILNCSLKAIGVGAARASNSQLYWTQDFGGR
jgi:uncharacterized protein YkwD